MRCERWVEQRAVLPAARAVICHAGSGTTLGARPPEHRSWLCRGSPTSPSTPIALPRRGPGSRCRRSGPRGRIGAALDEVLANEPPGCRPMAEAVQALPDVSAALRLIESVAEMQEIGLAATTAR